MQKSVDCFFRTWYLHYPQCNLAISHSTRGHLSDYMQLLLEPLKAFCLFSSHMQQKSPRNTRACVKLMELPFKLVVLTIMKTLQAGAMVNISFREQKT